MTAVPANGAAIAVALKQRLTAYRPGAAVWLEFGLCGHASRIDVAMLTAEDLHGYEVKGPGDSLTRLRTQIPAYGAIFDYVCVAAAPVHIAGCRRRLPVHWGLTCVVDERGAPLRFDVLAPPSRNPDVDGRELAKLLWREEALTLLRGLDCRPRGGITAMNKAKLWALVAETLPLDGVRATVHSAMRQRPLRWADRRGNSPVAVESEGIV